MSTAENKKKKKKKCTVREKEVRREIGRVFKLSFWFSLSFLIIQRIYIDYNKCLEAGGWSSNLKGFKYQGIL